MKTPNEIIAEYAGLVPYAPTFNGDPKMLGWYDPNTHLDDIDRFNYGRLLHPKELKFHEDISWLYPVYIKIRKELIQWTDQFVGNTDDEVYAYHKSISIRQAIVDALISGSIPVLHSEIVKGIEFINENKKQ